MHASYADRNRGTVLRDTRRPTDKQTDEQAGTQRAGGREAGGAGRRTNHGSYRTI